MIGGYACQCRASYYTTLFRVIWQLCSPQTAHILTLPMQASIDGSAPRESSQHAYRCVVHSMRHHKHVKFSGRHFVKGCVRLNARQTLIASRSQDQYMQCYCYDCFCAIYTANQLSWHTCIELPRQIVIVCTSAVSCCCVDAADSKGRQDLMIAQEQSAACFTF